MFAMLIIFLVGCAGVSKITGVDEILQKEPPITTSLADAVTEVPFLDDFNPGLFAPMTSLPRTPEGGFILQQPGLYTFDARSYCLKAGTYAPSKDRGGDGYLYAPLKGPSAAIVRNILRKSFSHPEIPQTDIQMLLWAIIARTKISDMSRQMQLTAAKLLTPQELLDLNGGAIGLIPKKLLDQAIAKLPSQVRQALETEASIREMLTTAQATYEDVERVAVLQGDPPSAEGDREVPWGRWSYHPDGFFIRYFPSGYSQTEIQISVPENLRIERDALGRITSIADSFGSCVKTEYDDTIEPVRITGEPSLKGYAFRSIRFECFDEGTPGEKVRTEWTNVGWTLLGVPAGGGHAGTVSDRFSGLNERYERALTHKKELNDLDNGLKKLRAGSTQQGISPGGMEEIMDLGHYAIALQEAIGSNSPDMESWFDVPFYLAKKAWQYALCRQEGGCTETGTFLGALPKTDAGGRASSLPRVANGVPEKGYGSPVTYNTAGNDAVPGSTGRQRLAMSNSSTKDDCAKIKKELKDANKIRDAFKKWDTTKQPDYNKYTDVVKQENDGSSPMATDYWNCKLVPGGNRDNPAYKADWEKWDECEQNDTPKQFEQYIENKYYKDKPDCIWGAARAHEQQHQNTCNTAYKKSGKSMGGIELSDPANMRADDIKAYDTQIKMLEACEKEKCK